MSNKSRMESEEETRRISITSESEEEEEEELDEFGRVKRRREKFVTERSAEEPDRSDSETEERRRHSRRHHSSKRRSSSASPKRYSRRYSDSDGEYSNSRHYRSSRSSYNHHSNNNSHHYHHRHRRRGDLYSEAAQYIDTEFYPTKVYIGDLVDVSKEQVESVFSHFGVLQEVKLVEGKDYGFITFEQKEAALAAIQSMHGTLLGSKHIKVNRAKIPERNKVGFGNVPWTDEDGLMAKEALYTHSHTPSSALMNDPLNTPDMNNLPPRRALTSYDDL